MDQMKKLQVTYSCELSFSAVDSKEGEKTWRLFKYEMDRASLIIASIFFSWTEELDVVRLEY